MSYVKRIKPIPVVRFELEDGIRMAICRPCPWCGDEHRHVLPADLRPNASPERAAKCGNGSAYFLLLDHQEEAIPGP